MAYLTHIATAVPKYEVEQTEFAQFYSSLSNEKDVQRKIKFLALKSGIDTRHTVMEDLSLLFELSLQQKMNLYHKCAKELVFEALNKSDFADQLKDVTDVILVSCTGMSAPGLEFDVIKEFGLSEKVKRHNIHFMGCYAGITALRQAKLICSNPEAKVLIIDVELCTLHFQKNFENDYLLSNLLFSDGCAVALVESKEHKGLKINDFDSIFVENTEDEMSWKISDLGFLMTLDAKVPESLKETMKRTPLSEAADLAMHPGGVQILKVGQEVYKKELKPSYDVLRNFGNMSSATIYFILETMLPSNQDKNEILAMAFGPGLTLETARLSHV